MALVAAAASIASAVVGVAGAIQSSEAAQAQANYQAQVARNNAVIAERKAQDAVQLGKVEGDKRRRLTRSRISLQRAKLAASGQLVDAGTALDLTVDTAAFGELDALTIESNARRQAQGFRHQATNFEANARLSDLNEKTASATGNLNTIGAVLNLGGTVAKNWNRF